MLTYSLILTEFQAKNINLLKAIDALKNTAETRKIWDSMIRLYNLDKIVEDDLNLPSPHLLSSKPEHEVIEIRNHLLATYFLHNNLYKLDREIDIGEIKKIHRILLKDIPKESVEFIDGRVLHVGEFRSVGVKAHGFHLTIYPVGPVYLFLTY